MSKYELMIPINENDDAYYTFDNVHDAICFFLRISQKWPGLQICLEVN